MKQMKRLSKMTVEELLFDHPSPSDRTVFQDYQIILAFFKSAGNMAETSKLVGYATNKTNTHPLRHRMKQISTELFLLYARNMLHAEQLTKDELKCFLENTKKVGGISKFHRNVASSILISSIDKCGSKSGACNALGISIDTMESWIRKEITYE